MYSSFTAWPQAVNQRRRDVPLSSRSFADVARTAGDAAATESSPVVVLHFYELVYYDGVADSHEGLPSATATDLWKGIRPSTQISALVRSALQATKQFDEGSVSAVNFSASLAFLPYGAAHVRTLEGSCIDRVNTLVAKRKLPFPPPAKQNVDREKLALSLREQCRMGSTPFRHGILARLSGKNETWRWPVFIAADNDGVRDRLARESDGVVFAVHTSTHAATSRLANVLVDFWVAVLAQRFVGNVASTMSRNICHVRATIATNPDDVDCVYVTKWS
jgi:hypothetical protein